MPLSSGCSCWLRNFLFAIAAGCATAWGAEAPVNIRVEVQMVSVSVAEARRLVPALNDGKTAQGAFDQVQEMLADGRAALLGWPIVWLRSGPPLVENQPLPSSESATEIRYATEYDSPRLPQTFGGILPTLTPRWGLAIPVAFETRDTEATLAVSTADEARGRVIVLNVEPQFVHFLGFDERRIQQSPLEIDGVMTNPNFWTVKTTSQIRVVHDRPTFIGSFVMPNPELHVELFILRARRKVLPPEAEITAPGKFTQ